MSEQQNLDVVRAGYDAFGRGDIAAFLDLLDPQISWVSPGPPDLPTAGTRRGAEAVAEFFRSLLSVVELTRFEPKEFIARGDRVIVLGQETAMVKATGKSIDTPWVHVFTVRGGKIVALEDYFDTSALVAELRHARAPA